MKSSITFFFALFLKGFLVSHEFFSIPCCTFELNLKCIFDKLELLFLFPLHENIVALLNWKYFWQIGTPFSSFLLHENFVSKGKEQKKITGSEYEIPRKKESEYWCTFWPSLHNVCQYLRKSQSTYAILNV